MILYSTEIVVMYGWELAEDCILNLADLVKIWSEADPADILKFRNEDHSAKWESDDSRYDRTMKLLDPYGDELKKVDAAFQRVVQILMSEEKESQSSDSRAQWTPADKSSSSQREAKRKRDKSEKREAPEDQPEFPKLELVVVTARCNNEEPLHRCFVALADRKSRWSPRNPFCNEVVPLNCSPIPAPSARALLLVAERLQLSTTAQEPAWVMCAAAGYSS